jgi:hypothetical protein
MKARTKLKSETNPTVENRLRRRAFLRCDYCPPHSFENKTYKRRGVRKPRSKNHR